MRTIKILLAIAGVLVTLLVAGGVVWWKKSGRGMLETVRVAQSAGKSLGRTGTADQCIDETVRRLGPAEFSLGAMIEHTSFLKSCAEVASGLDAVCASDRGLGLRERLTKYTELCRVRGARNAICPQVLQSLDSICRGRATGGGSV